MKPVEFLFWSYKKCTNLHIYPPHTEYDGKVMFSVFLSVHRGSPCPELEAPCLECQSLGGGAGPGPGQGLGGPPVKVQVKVQKGGGAGGMPFAVTQKDCLVSK